MAILRYEAYVKAWLELFSVLFLAWIDCVAKMFLMFCITFLQIKLTFVEHYF